MRVAGKVITIILLTISAGEMHSQEYFNKVFSLDGNFPNIVSFIEANNHYYVSSINFYNDLPVSSVIEVNKQDMSYRIFNIPYVKMTRNTPFLYNGSFYAYGDNDLKTENTVFLKMDTSFNITSRTEYSMPSTDNGPTTAWFLNNHLYGVTVFDQVINSNEVRFINIAKIDTAGNLMWSKIYNSDLDYSHTWEIGATLDSCLFVSSIIGYLNKFGAYAQLMKIDQAGKILWRIEGTEKLENGAIPIWITELSDGGFVQAYEVFRWNDPDYVLNDLNIRPSVLKWYDKDGNPGKEVFLKFFKWDNLDIWQMESGKEDYFFAYGQYDQWIKTSEYENYGVLIKYSNSGDTLWAKRYQHPEAQGDNAFNYIVDIIEEDNGDILIAGESGIYGIRNDIWIMKVDSNGCFGQDSCDETPVGVQEIKIGQADMFTIYPNPVDIELNIQLHRDGSEYQWAVYDIFGSLMLHGQKETGSEIKLDIPENLPSGMYIIELKDKKGNRQSGKFLKL
ncbi:MAG: T9SS type A sorting domain-containing protein [Deltaproteobacteria bacterium]